jgi:DNA-damage-inducible protein D
VDTLKIIHLFNETSNRRWSSRDFAEVLGYADYRNFENVIKKAKLACINSGFEATDHFGNVTEMVENGSGTKRAVKTVRISRYACYLAIQNSDPRKEIVAVGQPYFAIQTRRQELTDQEQLLEDEQRLLLREDLRLQNSQLADAAMRAGVVEPIDYAIFRNHGYRINLPAFSCYNSYGGKVPTSF